CSKESKVVHNKEKIETGITSKIEKDTNEKTKKGKKEELKKKEEDKDKIEEGRKNKQKTIEDKKKKEKVVTEPLTGNYMSTVKLNIRIKPGLSEESIGVLLPHQKAVASEKANVDGITWYKVKARNKEGWASANYLTYYK